MNIDKVAKKTYKLEMMYCGLYDDCVGCPFETTYGNGCEIGRAHV